jgi:hypothetical protein
LFITGIVLTSQNQNTGFKQIQFPQDISGEMRNSYVYFSRNLSKLARDTSDNTLSLWYSNYFNGYNKSTVIFDGSLNKIVKANVPGEIIFYNTVLLVNGLINTDARWEATSENIDVYMIAYNTPGSSRRYSAPISQQNTVYTYMNDLPTAPNNVEIDNLFPDSTYTFSVSANNTDEFSDPSTKIFNTSVHLPKAVVSDIVFPSVNTFSAKLVANNNSGDLSGSTIGNVIFSAPPTPWISNTVTCPIHNISTRGNSSVNSLYDISCALQRGSTNIESIRLSYSGFGTPAPNSANGINLSINTLAPVDSYAAFSPATQGFYLQGNVNVSLNSSVFIPSNDKTTLTIRQKQNSIEGNTKLSSLSFYYDNYSALPIIDSFSVYMRNISPVFVSVVSIIYGSVPLTGNSTVRNIGRYFYNKDKIITYSSGQRETNLVNVTSGISGTQLNESVSFSNQNLSFFSNLFQTALSLSAVAYNPLNTGSNSFVSQNINVIYDNASYNVITNDNIYPVTPQLVGNSVLIDNTFTNLTNIYGCRIWSGVSNKSNDQQPLNVTPLPPGISYENIIYNHAWNITSTQNSSPNEYFSVIDATEEIQLVEGSYISKGIESNNGYMDYRNYMNTVNYSVIPSTGYRFVTFCWKCNPSPQAVQYTKFIFKINGLSNNFSISPSPNYLPLFDNGEMLLYYRTEDVNNTNSFSQAYKNSTWINATSVNYPITSTNFYDLNGQYSTDKIIFGGRADVPEYNNHTVTVKVNAVSNFNVSSVKNYNIYLRIGLPMNSNCKFSNVTCSIE